MSERTPGPMERDELERALTRLSAYGGDPARWPDADRPLFFAAALEDEASLDVLLADSVAPPVDAALAARLLADFPCSLSAPPRQRNSFSVLLQRFLPAGALAGLSALGFFVGAASAGSWRDDVAIYAQDTVFAESDAATSFWEEGL